jgi:hypothetical protein
LIVINRSWVVLHLLWSDFLRSQKSYCIRNFANENQNNIDSWSSHHS